MALRVAIFDLGQVCIAFDLERCYETWAERSEWPAERWRGLFVDHEGHDAFEKGQLSEEAFYERCVVGAGLPLSFDAWRLGWNALFTRLIEPTWSAIGALKKAGVRVVALSNTNAAHVWQVERQFPGALETFDALYLSHELGARKPDPSIYESVLHAERIDPAEAVFFDDKLENVQAGDALGMDARHFVSEDTALVWLQDFTRCYQEGSNFG